MNDVGALYVSFQSGAMPGCYAEAGGYLYSSNSKYKELYALLLTMMANGGVRAAVLYTQVGSSGWSACTIDGIYLMPQ